VVQQLRLDIDHGFGERIAELLKILLVEEDLVLLVVGVSDFVDFTSKKYVRLPARTRLVKISSLYPLLLSMVSKVRSLLASSKHIVG
jgi:hypothetical protein